MRRITFVFLGLALVLASGGAAVASPVNPVTVTLTWSGDSISNDGTVDVGPYQLNVGGQTVYAPCDDFDDYISLNESWQAYEVPLTDYTAGLFGNEPDAKERYWAAAYLTTLFGNPNYSYNDISFAIWGLFESDAQSNTTNYDAVAGALATNALDLAAQNDSLNDFRGWQILTPVPGSQPQGDGLPQEFISPTPEPATLVMMGSGLLAVGLALRKRAARPLA